MSSDWAPADLGSPPRQARFLDTAPDEWRDARAHFAPRVAPSLEHPRQLCAAAQGPDLAAHFHEIKPVPRQFAERFEIAGQDRGPRARLRVPDFVTVVRSEVPHGISIMFGVPGRCFSRPAAFSSMKCCGAQGIAAMHHTRVSQALIA